MSQSRQFFLRRLLVVGVIVTTLHFCVAQVQRSWFSESSDPSQPGAPLVMKGGDPYLRALMRTISASESNVERPYHVIYGGKYVNNLRNHPDHCVTIVSGPNKGNCSTAAGRYQMLSSTWEEMAQRYHPAPSTLQFWQPYSFEPKYQDEVVHAWLADTNYWRTDISQLLRQGQLKKVLKLLSGTWTSLGYGIETNSMSASLPRLYQKFLAEELQQQS